MKSTYREYMHRQTVSADLHSKLLALEQEQKKPAVRSLSETHACRWCSAAALAASLVLVVGLGCFVAQSGLLSLGSSADSGNASAMESAAITEEPVWEEGSGAYGFDYPMEAAASEEPQAAPETDAAIEAEESAFSEEREDINSEALEWTEQNAALLMEALPFTDENAVLGTAQRLGQAGCGRITEIEVEEDDGRVYVLNLTDQNGHVFHTVVDYKGYIGPIQDEEGNYLYAPIE